jgi:hypothetical protein
MTTSGSSRPGQTLPGEGPSEEKLTIALEEIGSTSWWARILTTLGSQYGSMQLRFVGQVDGKTRYKSSTFPAARPVGPMAPEERWAPGMAAALAELQQDLTRDGWVRVGKAGAEPWATAWVKGS